MPLLVVDTGDFLHRDRERNLPLSRITWEEFRRSGYDAVTFGKEEFSQWDLVRQWLAESPVPVVCTNVEQLINGEWRPIGEKHRLVTVNGVRIGILGVTSANQLPSSTIARHNDTLRLLPPLETVQQAADALRASGKAEMIVLLAEVENDAMDQYASLLRGVDVIVGGYQPRSDMVPTEIGDAIVNRAASRGQMVASTQVIVGPDGRIVDWGGQNMMLTDKMPESQELLDRIKDAKNESTLRMREVNRQDQEEARAQRAAGKAAAEQDAPGQATAGQAPAEQTAVAPSTGAAEPQPAGRPE